MGSMFSGLRPFFFFSLIKGCGGACCHMARASIIEKKKCTGSLVIDPDVNDLFSIFLRKTGRNDFVPSPLYPSTSF